MQASYRNIDIQMTRLSKKVIQPEIRGMFFYLV